MLIIRRCSTIDNLNKGASTQCLRKRLPWPLYLLIELLTSFTREYESSAWLCGVAEAFPLCKGVS